MIMINQFGVIRIDWEPQVRLQRICCSQLSPNEPKNVRSHFGPFSLALPFTNAIVLWQSPLLEL